MDKQLAASYDDVCRICGELYIQVQLKLKMVEENQMQLVNDLNKQVGKTSSDNERLQKELNTLRIAYNELYAKGNSNSPAIVGENKD
jgi:hypothetical protein